METVVLLSKLCPEERKVEITLNLEDVDLTKAESKATYEQIQDYVYDKYGFKVSHLYVAQVKRKHFIIERENYNLPKTNGNRVPECPEEKVLAIEDALRYYKMIR